MLDRVVGQLPHSGSLTDERSWSQDTQLEEYGGKQACLNGRSGLNAAAGTGPMGCADLCPKRILVGRVVDQTSRAVKHAQARSSSIALPSVNIPHSFVIQVSRLNAPVSVSKNLIHTDLSIAAGYVRYEGSDYNEGSAILVYDPKAKTLSGAQSLP